MDHAEGDRRVNEDKEVVVEKERQQFQNAAAVTVVGAVQCDTMSVFDQSWKTKSQYESIFVPLTIKLYQT